ncbi:for [Symbiodinium natans]|uniref:For protein n=1 Tax=Symbiodinium natans TaxID=878477 RepID=A0A812RJ81_9DINO|nr:for [Symbiodinium natans]
MVRHLDAKVDGLSSRLKEVESRSQEVAAKVSVPAPPATWEASREEPSAEAIMRHVDAKVDGLANRLKEVASSSRKTTKVMTEAAQEVPSTAEAMVRHLDAKVDGLSSRLKEVESRSQEVAAKVSVPAPSPTAWEVPLRGSMAPPALATTTLPMAPSAPTVPIYRAPEAPSASAPVAPAVPAAVTPAPQVIIKNNVEMDPQVKASEQRHESEAALHGISDKVDHLEEKLSNLEPQKAAQTLSQPTAAAAAPATEAAMRHLNAKVDGLADRLKEMESRGLATSEAQEKVPVALPSAGQVQLVNAKADMEQAIQTAAIGGHAQIEGKVDAADHAREEVIHGLNISLESAMTEARASLQSAESRVAETAREAVDGTLASVLKTSMENVIGIGVAADSLKSEAEALQSNATTLLDQVEDNAALGKEAVAPLPTNSALVEQRMAQIQAELKDMSEEATGAEALADASLEAVEAALQVVNRSVAKAQEARSLRGRAAEQVALNEAKIREIRQALTGTAGHFCKATVINQDVCKVGKQNAWSNNEPNADSALGKAKPPGRRTAVKMVPVCHIPHLQVCCPTCPPADRCRRGHRKVCSTGATAAGLGRAGEPATSYLKVIAALRGGYQYGLHQFGVYLARDIDNVESEPWQGHQVTGAIGGGGGGSPPKRKAAGEGAGAADDIGDEVHVVEGDKGAVTLESIKMAFKTELSCNNERIKKEIQQAVGGVQAEVASRIGTVETEVTKQLQTTLAMLSALTDKQAKHMEDLQGVREEQAAMETRLSAETRALGERVEAMEWKMKWGGGGSTNSTTTAEVDTIGAPKQPALILGGWEGDTPAAEVLQKAKDVVRQLQLDVDVDHMFGAHHDETGEGYRQRIQNAITKVRQAKPPERRRRARLAAKVKRCILELGGHKPQIEAEFATGTVWYRGVRISSAATQAPRGADFAGPGWVDTKAMAEGLDQEHQAIQEHWRG